MISENPDIKALREYLENQRLERIVKRHYDHVAEANNKIVGAAWVRIMDDYGHIDDETPSLIISVEEEYRGKGIGKSLLSSMISLLTTKGYKSLSLSCQKENYACDIYRSFGFYVFYDIDDEYIMRKDL